MGCGFLFAGCGAVYFVGMPFVYDTIRSDSVTEHSNERYYDGPTEEDKKTRLDLFVPEGRDWPTLVFVHGGGWTNGDKDLRVGGKDVYRNIGRFFASRGVAAAVINYRLLPGVHWTTQIKDVGRAVLYARERAREEGGDPTRLFLSGHSAGAQLVTRIALDAEYLVGLGSDREIVCGVIAVSGAGYDMEDAETYALGADFDYLDSRFSVVDRGETWPADASVMQFIDGRAPPFLVVYGGAEHPALQHQSMLLSDQLEESGVAVDTVVEEGTDHARMVLALSRKGSRSTDEALDFIERNECGTPPATRR